jgi:Ca-activated chloride channel family protein
MNTDDIHYEGLRADAHNQSGNEASERELGEALITAYALGELTAAETAVVERMLADTSAAEARRQVAEVRAIAAALRSRADASGLTRSTELRRTVLAAVSQTEPSPRSTVRRSMTGQSWLVLAGALAATVLVVVTQPAIRGVLPEPKKSAPERLIADARTAAAPAPAVDHSAEMAARRQAGQGIQEKATRDMTASEAQMPQAPPARPVADGQLAAGATVPSDALASRNAVAKANEQFGRPGDKSQLRLEAAAAAPAAMTEAGKAAAPGMADRFIEPGRSPLGEGYAAFSETRPVSPKDQPLSTFSIDVDTASYANVRRFLNSGRLPPRDAVRIEELVNYFRYEYPQPEGDVPFSVMVDAAECPWNRGHRLVRIGLQGRAVDRDARPAGNLVFLIDVSGSMQAANKLPLVQQALSMLVEELSENDRVSIVTYAGNAGLVLPPTTGDQKQTIRAAIESLAAGGSTHGSAGIALAYEQAREHFVERGANRVILATDGDLNVGVTSTTALTDLIKEKAKGGVFLTVLGFGDGNLQDEKMEAIADKGNGIYAYVDGVREARKVLVEQLTGSTVTIAKDVKIQVEFNPAQVASYRLLGYENRALAARDFRDDTKDAGEIGAGHGVTALYEIALVDETVAGGPGIEPLKYQPRPEPTRPAPEPAADHQLELDPAVNRELLTVKLRWKRPDASESTGLDVPLVDRGPAFDGAPADLRFAAAVAAYGMILRGSDQKGEATLPLVAKIAASALGRDDGGYRAEFLDLVRKAESLGASLPQ